MFGRGWAVAGARGHCNMPGLVLGSFLRSTHVVRCYHATAWRTYCGELAGKTGVGDQILFRWAIYHGNAVYSTIQVSRAEMLRSQCDHSLTSSRAVFSSPWLRFQRRHWTVGTTSSTAEAWYPIVARSCWIRVRWTSDLRPIEVSKVRRGCWSWRRHQLADDVVCREVALDEFGDRWPSGQYRFTPVQVEGTKFMWYPYHLFSILSYLFYPSLYCYLTFTYHFPLFFYLFLLCTVTFLSLPYFLNFTLL